MRSRRAPFSLLILLALGLAGEPLLAKVQKSPHMRDWDSLRALPKKFNVEHRLKLPKGSSRIGQVVYGHPSIGYFEANDFALANGELTLRFIPPTYRQPILVFARSQKGVGAFVRIGSLRLQSPLPAAFSGIDIKAADGAFTTPFFLLGGTLPLGNLDDAQRVVRRGQAPLRSKQRFSFVMVVNRLGELVWVYIPAVNNQPFHSYINVQQVEPGNYAFLLGEKDGYFAVVDQRGEFEARFLSKQKSIDLPMHHDFIVSKDHAELVTLSNDIVKVKEQGLEVSYLVNNIVRVDLERRTWKELLNFTKYFQPGKDPYWVENKQRERFVGWGLERADHDFVHANSLNPAPSGGVLTALKHLDRIVMLRDDFSAIAWVAGPSPKDDFRVSGKARFSHPHSPRMRDSTSLVMFDNGFRTRRSRILELRLDRAARKADFAWEWFPPRKLYSGNRSSVAILPNTNVLAYFVAPKVDGRSEDRDREHDYLYEVAYPSGRVVASMKLSFAAPSAGFHAVPMTSIGSDLVVSSETARELAP